MTIRLALRPLLTTATGLFLLCPSLLACSGKSSPSATSDDSVLERNHHPSRDGLYVQPTLTKVAVANLAMETTFNATFTGNTWASRSSWRTARAARGSSSR